MKILMVTMSMNIGGAETHILELCRELHGMGHDITLASFGGVYADELVSLGIRHVTLPLHTKNPASVMKSYRGLEKLILEEKFDIVHAHARIPSFICGLLRKRHPFRFVTTAHLNFSVNILWRMLSCWGSRVMAVSEDISDYLVDEYGFSREKIYQTINGIDTLKFSPDTDFSTVLSSHGLDASHKRIVYVSRLDADRAAPAYRLLEAAPKLHDSYPDADIIIVGGGTELEALKNTADRLNGEADRRYIVMTGPESNINEYAVAADIFIGVSRSALEAMSAARPVIIAGGQGAFGIFDESKIKPAVETNFCCRGWEMADCDALYSWISELLMKSDDELKVMGEYNRRFILDRYTSRRMAEDYVEMYEDELRSPIPYKGTPDIVISGYYGFGNLGDESLLDIIVRSLSENIPNVRLAALARHPGDEAKKVGIPCIARFDIPRVYGVIRKSKLLLSGGGSLLQDSTSRRSLKYYAAIIRMAESAGVKANIYANGIGPIEDKTNRRLTVAVTDSAERVSVRDPDSADELRKLGSKREKIEITADPAFMIKPYSEARLVTAVRRNKLPDRFFAVSLRPASGADTDKLTTALADECVNVWSKYGLTPVVIPMQPAQDADICGEFIKKYSDSSAGREAVLYSPENAPELIAVLGRAEFVIAMRLHAIIFSSTARTPVIGVVYDPKVSSMMKLLKQNLSVSPAEIISSPEKISEMTAHVVKNRTEIKKVLETQAELMWQKCMEDIESVKHELM